MSKLNVGDKVKILNCDKMFPNSETDKKEGEKYKNEESVVKYQDGNWFRLEGLPYLWKISNLEKL